MIFHLLKNDASLPQEITRTSQTYRRQNQSTCPACWAFLSRRAWLPWHAQQMCAITIVSTVLKRTRQTQLLMLLNSLWSEAKVRDLWFCHAQNRLYWIIKRKAEINVLILKGRSCNFHRCFRLGQSFLCRREGVGHCFFFINHIPNALLSNMVWHAYYSGYITAPLVILS